MRLNERGFIMVMSMVTLVVLTVMGVGGLMISGFQNDIARRVRCHTSSLQCAEIGEAMIMARYDPHLKSSFPALLDISVPTSCRAIFIGHLEDQRDTNASGVVGTLSDILCTNNVGCEKAAGVNYYRTYLVAQAENCQPVEIEFVVGASF